MLKFGDSNFIWSDLKSLRCDICGEIIIMRFFGGIYDSNRGIKHALLITTHIHTHTHIHIYIYIYMCVCV